MIGQLKIVELREKVEARLGDKFSIKAFHNAVLRIGAVPLSTLEAEIDRAFPQCVYEYRDPSLVTEEAAAM